MLLNINYKTEYKIEGILNEGYQRVILIPKSSNSQKIIEENDDIENLTEGEKFYRVWKDGEFQLYEVPIVQKDGSIILPKDTLSNISEEVESNIDIKSTDYKMG